MAEYIGSRISLISKRDIRYVGTLHEISSENSTVALENVKSFGTEDRQSNPTEFVPAGDNVYEYIVFRGSDVKDLRIEKEPEKPLPKAQVPDDPAILGNARPSGASAPQVQNQNAPPESSQSQQKAAQPPQFGGFAPHQQGPPRFPNPPQYPYGFPNQRFGLGAQGPPPPYGYPGAQYVAPNPGWPYPPPGQGYPHGPPGGPGQFYPPNMNLGPPDQGLSSKPTTQAEAMGTPKVTQDQAANEKEIAKVKLPSSSATPAAGQNGPRPPLESKPDVAEALAPPAPTVAKDGTGAKAAPSGPKSGRIMPAIPMMSPAQKLKQPVNGAQQAMASVAPASYAASTVKSAAARPAQQSGTSLEDANRDARAAVAAAMAKLPPAARQPKKQANGEGSAIDNLTNKVNEMRTNDSARPPRQPGTSGYNANNRGGRGGYRGGRPRTASQTKTIEVPKTDYDFESANAKFNKEELAKEAVASPIDGANGDAANGSRRESEASVVIPPAQGYNKSSSFFDNISSESKDREDPSGKRLGGREFRNEEQKKNLDTFGQGSVDNGYRGGFRGRGRGGGRIFRGGGRGRGAPRGRGGAVGIEN